jgi:hypothetical protein
MTPDQIDTYRDNLRQALYSGELTVRDSDGKQMTFRSVAEIREALSALNRESSASADAPRIPRSFRINVSKGV